jgi:hypothetical protein
LSDQRCEGINLRFTDDMKNFVIVLLEQNLSKTTIQVQNAIKNRFEVKRCDGTLHYSLRNCAQLTWTNLIF